MILLDERVEVGCMSHECAKIMIRISLNGIYNEYLPEVEAGKRQPWMSARSDTGLRSLESAWLYAPFGVRGGFQVW